MLSVPGGGSWAGGAPTSCSQATLSNQPFRQQGSLQDLWPPHLFAHVIISPSKRWPATWCSQGRSSSRAASFAGLPDARGCWAALPRCGRVAPVGLPAAEVVAGLCKLCCRGVPGSPTRGSCVMPAPTGAVPAGARSLRRRRQGQAGGQCALPGGRCRHHRHERRGRAGPGPLERRGEGEVGRWCLWLAWNLTWTAAECSRSAVVHLGAPVKRVCRRHRQQPAP